MDSIEDIKSSENETAQLVERFSSYIKERVAEKIKGEVGAPSEEQILIAMQGLPTEEMQGLVKSALWKTFKWDWITAATFVLIGESTGVFSCYFISFLVEYLRNE